MKIGLRIFLGYFLIVGLTAWLSLKLVLDELKPVVRQVSEENLVELANTLALVAAPSLQRGELPGGELAGQLQQISTRQLDASIWRQHKTRLHLRIYITDARGIVLFDSAGEAVGRDYSRWNDVYLTLRGQYGVRSSRSNPDDEQSTTMHVAAPVSADGKTLGVLTVALPNQSTQPYIDDARQKLLQYGLGLLGFSLLIGIGFTAWLIWSLRQISHYALAVSENRNPQPPKFARGTELEKLADALETMRERLEGKAYVEQYVHSLTHELKSPLAAIQAASELLADSSMPADKRQLFLQRIAEQSDRLHQLIQRLLELAKLEQRRGLEQEETLALVDIVEQAQSDLQPLLHARQLQCAIVVPRSLQVRGERFLLQQAVHNILANAAAFAETGTTLRIAARAGTDFDQGADIAAGASAGNRIVLQIDNDGPTIPDYALARLGERFYSLARPDGSKGSGLGLSFVREVLALHGGRLQIDNHERGVRVRLYLPGADS